MINLFKIIEYYFYLIIHKLLMLYEIIKISFELFIRVLKHDNSKFKLDETKGFLKIIGLQKEGQEYFEILKLIKKELKNHYKRNNHHPEHYKKGINEMNLTDIIEMFCDWKASNNQRHNFGTIELSLGISKKRYKISNQLTKILFNTIRKG